MKHVSATLFTILRLVALAATCIATATLADDYSDVTQLMRAGKLSEAMTNVDVYLSTKPSDPQMRFLKGVIQRNAGKQLEAITTFTKLTEDYPELPEPYNNLAVLYARQNQFERARTALEMAIRLNPGYATAYENLGDVHAKLAGLAYAKALQLDSANAELPPRLALIRDLFKPDNKNPSGAPQNEATVTIAPVKSAASENPVKDSIEVENVVNAWANAWSVKDVTAYLSVYSKEFAPAANQTRTAWEDGVRKSFASKFNIGVKVKNLNVTVKRNNAVAKFRLDYRSDSMTASSYKTLEMAKSGDKWQIVSESPDN